MTWPFTQAPYGSYSWLKREIGHRIPEAGADYGAWSHEQEGAIDSIIQSGVMQVYYPPPLEQVERGDRRDDDEEEAAKDRRFRKPHRWSFLNQLGTLTTTGGVSTYELPEDFAGPSGDLIITSGDGRLPIIPEEHLRQLAAVDQVQGVPKYAAIRPVNADGTAVQKWQVILYPTPEKAFTLNYRYTVTPGDLSDSAPWPLGGKAYSELFLQSCLAVMEARRGGDGVEMARFMQRLAAAVHLDKQSASPTSDSVSWKDIDESDPGLALMSRVGLQMGFGQNPDGWTDVQRGQIRDITSRGVRRFYLCAPEQGRGYGHQWSFLEPMLEIELVAGQYAYDLPEDYGTLKGPLTYSPGDNVIYPRIEIVGEHRVRQSLQASIQASGRPLIAGVAVKADIHTLPARYEIVFWPVPDGNYQLQGRYQVVSDDSLTIIHGAKVHFETILEACLAEADVFQRRRTRIHEERFLERLAASVSHDRMVASPESLGYSRDNSDRPLPTVDARVFTGRRTGVTYNGNLF